MPMPVASYSQKNHIASQFNCLDPRNVMVPLMKLLAACDASAGTNGVT